MTKGACVKTTVRVHNHIRVQNHTATQLNNDTKITVQYNTLINNNNDDDNKIIVQHNSLIIINDTMSHTVHYISYQDDNIPRSEPP